MTKRQQRTDGPGWKTIRAHEKKAVRAAEEFVEGLEIDRGPVDPLSIASAEHPDLKAIGHDVGNRFDGRLEYHPHRDRFLLLYNTKYDTEPGVLHPRTRFSVAHELGHYLLDHHRAHLLSGGDAHDSKSEYSADDLLLIEREADAFASGLLLPSSLVASKVNQGELTRQLVEELASSFETSRVATLRRSVELSHFPCAVVSIVNGGVSWRRHSDSLIEAGCWPSLSRELRSDHARNAWRDFTATGNCQLQSEARIQDWFETYERDDLVDEYVTEQLFPIPSMATLIVLLTVDEDIGA